MKDKHPELEKVCASLRQREHPELAEQILRDMPLPLQADAAARGEWLCRACRLLREHLDEATIRQIRRGCVCTREPELRIPGYREIYEMTQAQKIKYRKIYEDSASTEEFAAKVSALENRPGQPSLELVNGRMQQHFYQCHCPFLQDVTVDVPKEWCYCTLGNSEEVFSYAMRRPVVGTLLESIRQGDSRCTIQLE
ncbi:MAG: DUF6144 family protein [Anaerovoracaceae bacterium]|jgi:hypothetical protein